MIKDKLNQQTLKAYDKISKDYAAINHQPEFWLDEFNVFKKILPGKKILDIGCGTGRDAILFTMHNYDYLGIDASAGMLKVAKTKAPKARFKKANFYSLSGEYKNFDGFWASASLLHVPKNNVKAILESFRKTIKDNGAGFISLRPRLNSIDEQVVPHKRYKGAARFFAYYTKTEFKKLLNDSGFKVLKVTKKLERPENKIWLCFFIKKSRT